MTVTRQRSFHESALARIERPPAARAAGAKRRTSVELWSGRSSCFKRIRQPGPAESLEGLSPKPLVQAPAPFHDWCVAQIVFSSAEKERITEVSLELETTATEFFHDAQPCLSEDEWSLLIGYARACVRRALEIGSLLHALVDGAAPVTAYPGRGRAAFVKGALEKWRDCFSPVPDVWRLAAVCHKVPGGEQRVKAEVTVLETMAADRMFGTFDREYEAFFRHA